MELRDYDLYAVPPRWLFLRLETADGEVGWGEPVVEGRVHTVRAAVEDYLLGEDPIATGERMYHRTDVRDVLASGAVDVVQPDLSHAGGITEVNPIAAMADAHDVALAPHCPLGPVALAACLQLDAVAHDALIQETSTGIHYDEGAGVRTYLDGDQFALEGGFLDVPGGPGLGVELDGDAIGQRAGDPDWHDPVWRHDDGSVAEW